MINIRFENSEDQNEIRHINIEAFDTDVEANLVDTLRKSGAPIISMVAEENGKLVGHILFSPVTLSEAPRPQGGASVGKTSGTAPKPPGFALRATPRSPLAIPPRASARGILAKASENKRNISIAGLGPMAVQPERQNQGIGSRLVEEGLKECDRSGYEAVVVLGHPNYYPRFGFLPSVNYGIKSEFDVPEEVFMIKEIHTGALDGCSGTVRYHHAFK